MDVAAHLGPMGWHTGESLYATKFRRGTNHPGFDAAFHMTIRIKTPTGRDG
jgi:hypothetical protein